LYIVLFIINSGVIVPGGFGTRGVEGKIEACKWCRENRKPFLGICLGLQVAVIEFARYFLSIIFKLSNIYKVCYNKYFIK